MSLPHVVSPAASGCRVTSTFAALDLLHCSRTRNERSVECPRCNRYTDSQSTCDSRRSSTASEFQLTRPRPTPSPNLSTFAASANPPRHSKRDDSVAVFCTACDDRQHEGCLCRHRASRHHKFREGLRIHASLQSEVHGTFERPAQGDWPLGARNDQGAPSGDLRTFLALGVRTVSARSRQAQGVKCL